MKIKTQLPVFIILFLVVMQFASGQSMKQEKMEQLNFMVGEWIGTSTIYENGTITKQVPAFQRIRYDLNKSILVVELNSELLLLHTIIQYNEVDETYYYYPFSERGTNRYLAEYKDGQLIVNSSETNRFIFGSPTPGTFREYGERLVDGEWVKYFEDNFKKSE